MLSEVDLAFIQNENGNEKGKETQKKRKEEKKLTRVGFEPTYLSILLSFVQGSCLVSLRAAP